jgi:hypothetical protein
VKENRRHSSQDAAEGRTIEIEIVLHPESETAVIMCGVILFYVFHTLSRSMCKFVLRRFDRDKITVRLLDHVRGTNSEADTIDRKVQRVVTHSRFDGTTFNNDIALLRLDREIPFEGLLRPVCLPELGMLSLSIYKNFISLLLMS